MSEVGGPYAKIREAHLDYRAQVQERDPEITKKVQAVAGLLNGGGPDANGETRARRRSLGRWRNVSILGALLFTGLSGFCIYKRFQLPGGNPFKQSYYTDRKVLWWTLGAVGAGSAAVACTAFAVNRHGAKGGYIDLEDSGQRRKVRANARDLSFVELREKLVDKKMVVDGEEVPFEAPMLAQYDLFHIKPERSDRAATYSLLMDLWGDCEKAESDFQDTKDEIEEEFDRKTRDARREYNQDTAHLAHRRRANASELHDARLAELQGEHLIRSGRRRGGVTGGLETGLGALGAVEGGFRDYKARVASHKLSKEEATVHERLERRKRPHKKRRDKQLRGARMDYKAFRKAVNKEAEDLVESGITFASSKRKGRRVTFAEPSAPSLEDLWTSSSGSAANRC